ncbi:MAG: AGE family epimerase/isomerase [Prevotella sp.]|nr:AGE family epimerase/isomerase [Bacteroidales bacterium]MDY4228963.1 AGE family epimerase/isomerase [Prevotella sp.]
MTPTIDFKQEMLHELEGNILAFWRDKMTDQVHGGFLGRIDGNGVAHPEAEKGAMLNACILWAFSAAYRVTRTQEWLSTATRAKDYFVSHFIDKECGGVYWSLNPDGTPKDTKKQTQAIGFAIYGLSEYTRATGDQDTLALALSLYHAIEDHAYDPENNGYIEALARDWKPIGDMRLSDKDENASRTMNTHLHIIESYTNLLRCLNEQDDDNDELRASVVNLFHIFTDIIINRQTGHLDLFFNDRWEGKRNVESFGHDIEAAWLLHEAALVLGDVDIDDVVRRVAKAADEGVQPDGSMVYEHWKDTGRTDTQRQWWTLCENVIGHLDLYQYYGDRDALGVALSCWEFIKRRIVDHEQGEWLWSVDAEGCPNRKDDKAGFWKGPYHNSRLCLEVLEREFLL